MPKPAHRPHPQHPSAESLHRPILPVAHSMRCSDVLAQFLAAPGLFALPIIDEQGLPVGILERHTFIEFFGKQFTVEIHGRKPVLQLIQSIDALYQQPITVDAATSVDDIARIMLDCGIEHMVSGFIVTHHGRYLGLANGHDLLNELTRQKQAELYHLAHYDHLTGIANRMLLLDRLAQQMRESRRRDAHGALLLIDVDRFKQINDSMGHPFGDVVLKSVASRLSQAAREDDTVARLGGDEFAVLMTHCPDSATAQLVAARITQAFAEPFDILGRSLFISVSIGIALFPRDADTPDGLLACADAAMYDVKRSGRNGFREYTESLAQGTGERLTLENELRLALELGQLALHYQPQLDASGEQVLGVEALLRWQHPLRGMVPPIQFIEIAEQSGLIRPIGHWVLREACRQQVAWTRSGLPSLRMAINISPLQFEQQDFCERVQDVIAETGIDPAMIELELTEGVVMQDSSMVMCTLERLQQMGVQLAIDDFGTGFSSLNYLRRFPIRRLKIDQSFVRDVHCIPVNESIIKAIVTLAKSLSHAVIAEGVETAAELAVIRTAGCDEVQGYHFSRPLPPDALYQWLLDRLDYTLPLCA